MAYHKKEIKKGEFGQVSKIIEEFEEFTDAYEQNDNVLMICELTDLIGAIDGFVKKRYNLSVDDLVSFSEKTQDAFITGKRS